MVPTRFGDKSAGQQKVVSCTLLLAEDKHKPQELPNKQILKDHYFTMNIFFRKESRIAKQARTQGQLTSPRLFS